MGVTWKNPNFIIANQKVYALENYFWEKTTNIKEADVESFELVWELRSSLIARDKDRVYIIGGVDGYVVLDQIDQHSVGITEIEWEFSTQFYLEDKNGLYTVSNSPHEIYFAKVDKVSLGPIEVYWKWIGSDRYKFMEK